LAAGNVGMAGRLIHYCIASAEYVDLAWFSLLSLPRPVSETAPGLFFWPGTEAFVDVD
jgi:hypothetical protein